MAKDMAKNMAKNMAKVYFTLTGTNYYHGSSFLKPGMKIMLEKEPDNKYDHEAIMVKMEGLGKIGYVANSIHTVMGESMSAGRLYDKIENTAKAKVVLVTPKGTLCKISKKSLIGGKEDNCPKKEADCVEKEADCVEKEADRVEKASDCVEKEVAEKAKGEDL